MKTIRKILASQHQPFLHKEGEKMNDLKLIPYVRDNARINLTTLSRKTGVPVSTIFDRIRKHEGKLITKFTVLLDFAELGFPLSTKILFKVSPEAKQELRAHLCAHNRVNNIFRINNGFDLAIDCVFRDIREAEEFVEALELLFPIQNKQVFHVIEDISREQLLTAQIATL